MSNRPTSDRVAPSSAIAPSRGDRAASSAVAVGVLGDWTAGSGPLYRRLARAVAGAVERGDLEPRRRLPSERVLGPALAVSRGVVVAAYGQLVAEGIVVRQVGSGTFVAPAQVGALPAGREGSR